MAKKNSTSHKSTSKKSKSKKMRTPAHPKLAAPKAKDAPMVHYTVEPHVPNGQHRLRVTLSLKNLPSDVIELQLPAWTPGSYMVRNFARNVSSFTAYPYTSEQAKDIGKGKRLKWEQVDKQTWRIEVGKHRAATVSFTYYANEFSVRTPHADDTHAFFQPTNCLPYVVGMTEIAHTLKIALTDDLIERGWKAFCPLPHASEAKEPNVFRAPNYDILADSPVEIGPHQSKLFVVDGKRHEIVVYGDGNYDLELWAKDFTKIVKQCKKTFGDLPYENYMFILHCVPGARGGLEHLNSQVSAWDNLNFEEREKYEDFLSLISHEFFHTWNVKRIRPEILGPFDYTTEQYTPSLWIMEGVTVHYEWLQLVRAGVISRERFCKALTVDLMRWENRPGNEVMTLEESAKLAWTKLYLADEDFINSGVSYYLKGGLVAMLLDLEIRKRTKNKHSLDDVMRKLYADYGWPKPGFPEGRIEEVVAEIAGGSWKAWFDKYLRSTKELKFDAALKTVGMEIARPALRKLGADGKVSESTYKPYMGWELADVEGRVNVTAVRDGSTAAEAGVSAKDQLLAIGEYKVNNAAHADQLLRFFGIAAECEITVYRGARLVQCQAKVGRYHAGPLSVRMVKNPSAAQKAAQDAWLG